VAVGWHRRRGCCGDLRSRRDGGDDPQKAPPCGGRILFRCARWGGGDGEIIIISICPRAGAPDHYGDPKDENRTTASTEDLNDQYKDLGLTFDDACIYGDHDNNEAVVQNCMHCSGCRSFLDRSI